ncbi:MAG: AraC family ligand binding domain-containing protein, partial [Phycisphaeraceae bacterium]|nr:AraC family ligand binding domain-containing protein [Phycisphaeraceae bacterium]
MSQHYPVTGDHREGRDYDIHRPEGSVDWLVILTLEGAGEVGHRLPLERVEPYDVVLFQPGIEHRYRTDSEAGRWNFVWAHFVPPKAWLGWLQWPERA